MPYLTTHSQFLTDFSFELLFVLLEGNGYNSNEATILKWRKIHEKNY